MAILLFTFASDFPSAVLVKPEYLTLLTSLILSPLMCRIHLVVVFFLDAIKHTVFFTFKESPLSSLAVTALSRIV